MNVVAAIGLAGLVFSIAAYVLSVAARSRLRRSGPSAPLPGFAPPVSILKPLCGVDEELAENLESFFRLDYESYEVVFSFASPEDPAYRVARVVADRHPGIRSIFVFDSREPGGNAKVNRLAAALRFARHRLVLFSDGNVRVRPDFLGRAVAFFADPGVGLVSHLFRAAGAVSLPSRVEASYLNGCLQPGIALIAELLRMPCVVGKSILVSRRALEAIGGIGVLRDYLAEDFLLGRAVRREGFRVALSADGVDTTEVRKRARGVWDRHRRWAMMRAGWGAALRGRAPGEPPALVRRGDGRALRRRAPDRPRPARAALGYRDPLDAPRPRGPVVARRGRPPAEGRAGRRRVLGRPAGTRRRVAGKAPRDREGNPDFAESGVTSDYNEGTALSPRRARRSSRFCWVSNGGSPGSGWRRT